MRIVFFGTPQFAVPALERLIESSHEIAAVITQPDKPAGRGRKLSAPPVKQLAEEHGLPVLQPQSVKSPEFAEQFAALAPDAAVVVAYGKILPSKVLETPRHGCFNIHASLLPKYRGAGPIQWAIVRGEEESGVTIMQMDEGMDTGPMVAKKTVPILEDDTTISLSNLLSLEGARLMAEVLDQLERDGSLNKELQNDDEATYAPLIQREDARIDWSQPFETIINAVHGFQPWPRAFTTLAGKELKILGAEACDPAWAPKHAFHEGIVPGMVVEVFKGRGFVVRTGGDRGLVLITEVQPEGKPAMGAFDFVNGGALDVGDRLGT